MSTSSATRTRTSGGSCAKPSAPSSRASRGYGASGGSTRIGYASSILLEAALGARASSQPAGASKTQPRFTSTEASCACMVPSCQLGMGLPQIKSTSGESPLKTSSTSWAELPLCAGGRADGDRSGGVGAWRAVYCPPPPSEHCRADDPRRTAKLSHAAGSKHATMSPAPSVGSDLMGSSELHRMMACLEADLMTCTR